MQLTKDIKSLKSTSADATIFPLQVQIDVI